MARERRTIAAMIRIYCRGAHRPAPTPGAGCKPAPASLCPDCSALLDYAMARLDRCPFSGAEKPACADCPVHCYKAEMRARVKEVMRVAGPRMLLRHPGLAIMHLVDGKKQAATKRKSDSRDF
jgi:hypothetical protein